MAMIFESHGVAGGCWRGRLVAPAPPERLSVIHLGKVVSRASLEDLGDGAWAVAAELPGLVIADGIHSLLLVAGDPGRTPAAVLGSLTLIGGSAAGDDLLAEVAQLRAELDLLKREFRRFAAGG